MPETGFFKTSLRRDACIFTTVIVGIAILCIILARHTGKKHSQPLMAGPAAAAQGRELFVRNCASCHGLNAQGMPHQGANLRNSRFIAEQTDIGLIKFLRVGRQPGDPNSMMGLQMPAKGGNATLDDEDLTKIVAYLRKMQKNAAAATQPISP